MFVQGNALDVDHLKSDVLRLRPDIEALAICGSALRSSGVSPNDIDLVGLGACQDCRSIGELSFRSCRLPVQLSIFHPSYFVAVALDEDLVFFSTREIRKIVLGRTIFDPLEKLRWLAELLRAKWN